MLYLLLFAGIGMTLLGLALGDTGNGGKAARRRLDVVRDRYGSGTAAVETQLRRITAQQASGAEGRLQSLLPRPDVLRRRIAAADKTWSLRRYVTACALLAVASAALMLFRGLPVLPALFLGLILGLGLPHLWLGMLVKRRVQRFVQRFPEAIELLVRGLRSGLPVSETLGVIGAEMPDPVGGEFRGVADRMRIGRTMEAALQETADRLSLAEFQFFVITLAIQRETGGNLAETLSNLADVLRKRLQMKLKVKAMASESKASAYIIGALPFLVFIMIYTVSPGYMDRFFVDQRLMLAAGGGAVWMTIGAIIMAKMISFEI